MFFKGILHSPFLVAAAIIAVVLSGCDRQNPQSAPQIQKFHVLSTVYPLADLVRQVAGSHAEVEWFCEDGLDPRDLKLTDAQLRSRNHMDLIATSGFRDLWAGDNLDSRQRSLRLLRPESTTTGRTYPDSHACLWLDPRIAKEIIEQIRDGMTMLDAKHASEYRAASEPLARQIDELDAEFQRRLKPLAGRKFLALRPTWAPLAVHYGLKEIAPLDTDPQRLTDEEIRTLKKIAQEEGTNILAVDAALLPGVQRELELRTGFHLLPLDLVGSSAPDGRSTWIKVVRYDLEQIEIGLK